MIGVRDDNCLWGAGLAALDKRDTGMSTSDQSKELRLDTRRDGDVLLIELHGELVFKAHQGFKALIETIETTDAERVRLDLKHLGRSDVTTLGLLMVLNDAVADAGLEMQFINASRAMAEISKLSQTGRKLDLNSVA